MFEAHNPHEHLKNSYHWISSTVSRYIGNIDELTSADLADPSKPANSGVGIELERANVFTSKNSGPLGGNHLLLDIDDGTVYIKESSTPGHYHIGFPNVIEDEDFDTLVKLLHKVGLIKEGNFRSYTKSGFLTLRTPWVKKGETKALAACDLIGDGSFVNDADALKALQKSCEHLGVEFPVEIYQQLNAKLVADGVDIPDSVPVDWK